MFDALTLPDPPLSAIRRVSRRDLHNYLIDGEGLTVEFKRQFTSPDKIAKEMIALANTKGGVILFGVDDDGTVVGVESEKSELAEIEHTAQFLVDPPLEIRCDIIRWDSHHDVVVVTIPESKNKPHGLVEYDRAGKRIDAHYRNGFVRVADKSVQASSEVMKVMRSLRPDAPPLRIAIGHNEKKLFEYLHTHERITVGEFAHLVNISRRRASKILVDLVRAGTILLHTNEMTDYYTLAE